ncbi:MAG TPA: energy-coupling factor transporter transmembrane component T [Ktedonobacteraceae bacterium]|nr:energy-coupling factor transporter transmembrane component T [Ktedonobacteraceae bacterium]
MFSRISLGVYYPGNSPLHRLQARTKLLVMMWLAVVVAIANGNEWHFAPYIAVVALLLLAIVLSGIPPRVLWQRLWLLLLLTLIGILPAIFFTNVGTKILATYGPWPVAYGTLRLTMLSLSIVPLAYLLASLLPSSTLRAMRKRIWFRFTRTLVLLLTIVALIFLWLTRHSHGYSLLPLGPIVLTYDGVWYTMAFFVAFLTLYTFSLLLTMTTSPIALIEGMTLLMTPLRWLKLPVDDFALMTLIALRFVPTLIEEAEQLIKAQIARGADLTQGTLRERLQSVTMLFVPFIQSTLRRASELATALEARGYQSEKRQTLLHEKAIQWIDILVVLVVALVTVGSLLL